MRNIHTKLSKKEVTEIFGEFIDFCAEKLEKIDSKNKEIIDDIKKDVSEDYCDENTGDYFNILYVLQKGNLGIPRNILLHRVVENLIRMRNATVNYLSDIDKKDERILRILDKYTNDIVEIGGSVSENSDALNAISSVYCVFLLLVDIFENFGLDLTYKINFWGGMQLSEVKKDKIKNMYTYTIYNLFKDTVINIIMIYIYYNSNTYKRDIEIIREMYDMDKNKVVSVRSNNRIRYAEASDKQK